jgi:hypothetical protein
MFSILLFIVFLLVLFAYFLRGPVTRVDANDHVENNFSTSVESDDDDHSSLNSRRNAYNGYSYDAIRF